MHLEDLGMGEDGSLTSESWSIRYLVEMEGWVAGLRTSTWDCQEVEPEHCIWSAIGGQCLSAAFSLSLKVRSASMLVMEAGPEYSLLLQQYYIGQNVKAQHQCG